MNENPAIFFSLISTPLDITGCENNIRSVTSGGEVIFVGTVRHKNRGKNVIRLEFEAFEPMALKELHKIAGEMKEKWSLNAILLHHRTGTVEQGEVAVIAAVSSAHRKEAFEACAFMMDRLKQTVPIWKKEIFEDGESWVISTP